jgi:signal peptidase II
VIYKRLAFFGVGLLVFGMDRFGKLHAMRTLEPGEHAELLGNLLGLTHVRVSSTAFGLLQDWGESVQLGVLALLSVACASVVIGFYRGLAPGEHGSAAALGAVLAGVAGNLFDRLRYGAGIDFLHVGPATAERLPDFNVSDLAIVLGVVTLIVELLASEMAARAQERPRR